MVSYLLFILLGFVSGSVMYSYFLPKFLLGVDVTRGAGDGNPGATNAITQGGLGVGMLALILDILKGALPVYWASCVLDTSSWLFVPVLPAPVLGHAFSPFLKGRGGKGIAVTFGCLLAIFPQSRMVLLLAALLLFFSFGVKIMPDGARVIIAMGIFIPCCLLLDQSTLSLSIGGVLCAGLVIFKHLMRPSREPLRFSLFLFDKMQELKEKQE